MITECSPEGFFHCNSSLPTFCPYPVAGYFLAGETRGSWERGGGNEGAHICTSILLRNKGTDPSGNKDLAYLEVSNSKNLPFSQLLLPFALGLQENNIF